MTEDNCFVYACIKAGVEEEIIDHMREIIRTRDFPQNKLQEISDATNLEFHIKVGYFTESKNNKTITHMPANGEIKQTIELLLVDDHYMLNERLPMTTYFIK
ncbi:organellar and viral DNA polymerase type B, partial [Trichomonas vaginalis G3]|uniref:organellar and viral DNA polymerase type B n=1 Tax=Trichomonas vaginalis (strain ATCC PRA-98 / G3) TaxID=412133 RepID=UPI0021E5895F